MNITLEVEVNTCFPLWSQGMISLKQDAYTLPETESPWRDINEFSNYISGSMELSATSAQDYWQLPKAKDFQKNDCNTAFSALIRKKTQDLESGYTTGIPTLECAASEWTKMFTYEFHNACQFKWKGIKTWHCMGRFNENGMLQFAFMHDFPVKDDGCTQYSLGTGDCNLLNKDIDGTSMLLADAEISTEFMLDSKGKLKKALNPVLIGVITNEQPTTCIENANQSIKGITMETQNGVWANKALIPGLFTSEWSAVGGPTVTWEDLHRRMNPAIQQVATTSMLGFIYTIWGTIYKNTMYMVAMKLPLPGTGSYLVKGTYDGTPTWYRLQTAKGDLHKDINPYLPGENKETPAITAADLCVIDDVDKTETFKQLEALGLIEEGSEVVIDPDDGGHLKFYPVRYTNFNVEKFLEWYGSDEELEDNITLATIDSTSGYTDGMKLNWQGDIFMNTMLTGDAGYLPCIVNNDDDVEEYTDMALSYYTPKTRRYKYCPGEVVPDPETEAMNMLLFTYSGTFPVGDPAGELTELADGALTAVAYLCTGTKQPEFTIGGFFNKPSIPCLMGANQICCNMVDCSESYNDGAKVLQQCGGPFKEYQIGNHKLECDDYRFDCNGQFLYCGHMKTTESKIRTKWVQPGLLHAGGACTLDKAKQPYETPYLKYTVGSRPLMVGGSIMGGVNYICANVRKIGSAYSILFAQGHAYNGWNSFYGHLGDDLTNVVAAEYDPNVRGDLAAGAPDIGNDKTEAMLYNDFAYTLKAPPTYNWEDAIVGFYPLDAYTAGNMSESAHKYYGVNVYIHKLDECERPDLYRIEVTGSAMKWLYDKAYMIPEPGIHMHAYTTGFIKRLGRDVLPTGAYLNATTMHMRGYWQQPMSTDVDHDIVLAGKDLSRTSPAWTVDEMSIDHHIMSGITTLHSTIHEKYFEDQEFIVSARAKTFHGVCSCFTLVEDSSLKPARTMKLRYKSKNGAKIDVTSSCWYYLALHQPRFEETIKKYNEVVTRELKLQPQGEHIYLDIPNPYLSWQVALSASVQKSLDASQAITYDKGTLSYNDKGATVFYMHPNEFKPVPAYITMLVNREDAYLHRTKFDLWLYDKLTKDDVIPRMQGLTNVEIPAYDSNNPSFDINPAPSIS